LIIFCAKEGDIMTLPSNTEEEKPYGSLDSESMSFGNFFFITMRPFERTSGGVHVFQI
jgi:hypothetical protein